MRGSSLCRLRLLYSAENREFALERISPSQTIISIKQQIVDAWPSDLSAAKRPVEPSQVRLLFAGHFLEDSVQLGELPLIAIGGTSTFHVIVILPPGKQRASSLRFARGSTGGRKGGAGGSAVAGREGANASAAGRGNEGDGGADGRGGGCGHQCTIS